MRRITLLFLITLSAIHFLSAQVSSKVEFKKQSEKEPEIISITWSKTEEENWKTENEGRLEIMSVKTDLHSVSFDHSNKVPSIFQFSLNEPGEIEALVQVEKLSPGEKIIFTDIRTGETIFELPHLDNNKVLTPGFDPAKTYLVWTGPANQPLQSVFTIRNIYVDHQQSNRDRAIGFGTAYPCHPNAACKQDSMLKLISNSAVRIRMVMDEGIGWCSGSFINNTRNDKSPFILTAYHCTFEYTPQYDLWRFDLQYKSDSCANPLNEPQYFSLTGCELKASGQGSDFLLVHLNNDVPINQQVTFAGWNRDDVAVPDTVYLVHHPNADIRKISTCTSEILIHPNQIGWVEGYTTPPNHHFRFKFTEGGHQPGSSGGPVFNQDGLLVAQLHGGSSGCEETNTAYTGRLAKSWSYGTTSDHRLSDWLDPDQTGAVQLPSIENIQTGDITEIQGTVLDPIGRPVKNTEITISGSTSQTMLTDSDGHFNVPGISRQGHYTITASKNDHPTNGVNALDLVRIQKHLLYQDTLTFAWQHIAADATNNNHISVGDMVVLLRLILGKITALPSSPSWRFDPPVLELDNLPLGEPAQVQFKAIKIGDLNNSANH
jgi:hypothetical protein